MRPRMLKMEKVQNLFVYCKITPTHDQTIASWYVAYKCVNKTNRYNTPTYGYHPIKLT